MPKGIKASPILLGAEKLLRTMQSLHDLYGSLLPTMSKGNERSFRSTDEMRLCHADFDFEVKYKKGKYKCHADFISRMDTKNHTVVEFDERTAKRSEFVNHFPTAYNLKLNGQTERFNRTMASALRHYVADHQEDWDLYSYLVTYAYNAHAHISTDTAPFSLVLSRIPSMLSLEAKPSLKALSYKDSRKACRRRLGIHLSRLRKIDDGGTRKLSPLADGPYYLHQLGDSAAVVKIRDNLETIRLDQIVAAPAPRDVPSNTSRTTPILTMKRSS
eukprot:IDg4180t1